MELQLSRVFADQVTNVKDQHNSTNFVYGFLTCGASFFVIAR